MTETLLDQLEASLKKAMTYNENVEVRPVALLWPDRNRQFIEAAKRLRARLPLLTFGELDASQAQGPAYWLRCAVAGTVDVALPGGMPVIYLPGVGREDLRAIEDCPRELAPIAELQYRGQWFAHPSGKDWTIRALLSNHERGLGYDIADDAATSGALIDAFGKLLERPARRLTSQHIDADFLQQLLNPDPIGSLLEWLDDPSGFKARLDEAQWKAFVAQSKAQFSFNPASEGEVVGGRLLGERQGDWAEVWRRFERNPEQYNGIEARLSQGRPAGQLFAGPPGAWPQDNHKAEDNLRQALTELRDAPAGQVRGAIDKLWEEHRDRRNWVWAKLERSQLVFALEQLHHLGQATMASPVGDVDKLVAMYGITGWKADEAFLAALVAAANPDDRETVAGAAVALYRPWLEAHAHALQTAIGPLTNASTYVPGPQASTEDGVATVFVDGLRLDLGHRLAERLGSASVEVDTTLAALPTVTDTAKPGLTPVPDGSLSSGTDLGPTRATSGAKASIAVLRSLMAERGVQVLHGSETGDPSGCAWTEAGAVDARGHQFQAAFVDEIDGEIDRIAKRVKVLLDAGWQRVDVVTDHGWLLVPGGLEKVDLPAATVILKKGRCARLKDGASVSVPTVPWRWDTTVRIALAPGVSCFEANQEYEHGGVSLQECVVPRLRVRSAATEAGICGAAITKVKWLGLMCRIEFENVGPGATVDIRALPADPSTSVTTEARDTTSAGKASIFVTDEDLEGQHAYVVIVGRDGAILAQRDVTIGANR